MIWSELHWGLANCRCLKPYSWQSGFVGMKLQRELVESMCQRLAILQNSRSHPPQAGSLRPWPFPEITYRSGIDVLSAIGNSPTSRSLPWLVNRPLKVGFCLELKPHRFDTFNA